MPTHAAFLSRCVLKTIALRQSNNLHIQNPLCRVKNDLHNELHMHKKEDVQNKHINYLNTNYLYAKSGDTQYAEPISYHSEHL